MKLTGIVQLEVTSRCNLACRACPHGAPNVRLHERDMPREIFERAVGATIRPGQRYHLQGWGEPLLRPDLPDLARSITVRGGIPSVTTNGTQITETLARSLFEAGLDFITLSIAAGRPEALEETLVSLRLLRRARKKRRCRKPVLAASYQLTRSSIDSLDEAARRLKKAGAERLIAVHPILTLTAEQEKDLMIDRDGRSGERFVGALRRAARAAMWRSLPFEFDPIEPDPAAVCREDPTGSLFVGASGDVFPCVYLGLPVGGDGQPRPLSMGNLGQRTLDEIWCSADYAAFREAFSTSGSPPPEPCRPCLRALGY